MNKQILVNKNIETNNINIETETLNNKLLIYKPTQKDLIKDLSIKRNVYSYINNFDLMLKSVLTETELNIIETINKQFKNYQELKLLENNKHLYRINRDFYFKFNELKAEYEKQIRINQEITKTELNQYYKTETLKANRNEKRIIIDNIKNLLKDYNNNKPIIRKQHYLKAIGLNQNGNLLYYTFDFNISKSNRIKNNQELLFFKLDNEKQNNDFDIWFNKTKEIIYHIGKHFKRNNKITFKGYENQLKAITKRFIRYNRKNQNINFNSKMILLFINHFELIATNKETENHINETIKELNLKKTNMYKDLFFTTETEYKPKIDITFKETKTTNNNIIKETENLYLNYKNKQKDLITSETEIYKVNSIKDNLKPLKEIFYNNNNYYIKADNGLYQDITTKETETINNNRNKTETKIKTYFITNKKDLIVREFIKDNTETINIYSNGLNVFSYKIPIKTLLNKERIAILIETENKNIKDLRDLKELALNSIGY